jgi:hypothetical protein
VPLVYNAQMTDKPAPTAPRQPLVLPPNIVDRTAERIGTVIGIVGCDGCGEGNEATMTDAA